MSHIPRRAMGPGGVAATFAGLAVLTTVGFCQAGEPEKPAAPPRPAKPRRVVHTPRSSLLGELPPGPATPLDKLPAQYFAALGRIHLQYAQWAEAEKRFREAYGREKDASRRTECAYALGQLHMRKKEYSQALPLVEEAVKNASGASRNYQTRRYRGVLVALYDKTKQPEKAEAVYQQWAKNASTSYERDMAHRELLRLWQRTGKLDDTIARYEATLKGKPDDKETLEILRLIYTSVKPQPQKALVVAEKLVAADPDNRDAAMNLLNAYERGKKHDKAIELAKQLMQKHPGERKALASRLVYLYVRSGQKDKARACATEMLEKGADSAEVHGRVAGIYLQLGMVDDAFEQYEAAAKLAKRPADREGYQLSAAHAARSAKKYDKAEKLAIELAKSRSTSVARQAKRLLFDVYEQQNRLDELNVQPRKR